MTLAARAQQEERMDAEDLPAEVLAAVLGDLAQVNAVTLAARPTLAFLERAARTMGQLRVLDVGFGDGAAAALVTSQGAGLALGEPFATTLADSADLIQWRITDQGFVMHLSGEVPSRIAARLNYPAFWQLMNGCTLAEKI